MKTKSKISTLILTAFVFMTISCNDILDENPKTVFTADYFTTPQGIQDGINAIYANMRYNYAPNGALALYNQGTDEWTYGDQPRTNTSGDNQQNKELDEYTLTPNNGAITTPWNRNYSSINQCNAILQFAPGVDITDDARKVIMAEARFFRAKYYMLLVSQFGAVPLDLGSGDLAFNTIPYTGFNRLPTDELLVKNYEAMIEDLIYASQNLPDQRPALQFKLSKAVALHLLARIYMFRAYSAVAQAGDFQSAYDAASELINNKAKYGVDLLPNYGDIHKEGNDYNKEILYSVERIPQNNANNEYPNPSGQFDGKVNIANNNFNCNYQQAQIQGVNVFPNRPLTHQRPLRKLSPTKWTTLTAFADKVNDSRYDHTFRTMWKIATLDQPGTAGYTTYVNNMAAIGKVIGDTAIYLPPTDAQADALKAQSKNYFILGPKDWYTNQTTTWNIYPALKKYDDSNRAGGNDVSGRAFPVYKFSDTYLLAAEAAMQLGNATEAATLINVLKKRAAFRTGLSSTEIDNRFALIEVDASDINLDFILDERTRELCGESMRWVDLAMRGKLIERAKAYNPESQNIQAHHVLRPIPQSQLDAITDTDKAKYQNPGY